MGTFGKLARIKAVGTSGQDVPSNPAEICTIVRCSCFDLAALTASETAILTRAMTPEDALEEANRYRQQAKCARRLARRLAGDETTKAIDGCASELDHIAGELERWASNGRPHQ
jgi:hypothetical protein